MAGESGLAFEAGYPGGFADQFGCGQLPTARKRKQGWGDDAERVDSLSIAATTWMYLGKNQISCFANAELTPAPVKGDNIAPDGTATASSYQAENVPPSKAIDENAGTRWTSQYSDPQWIQVDLGSAEKVCEVVLKWENATVFDDEYKIQSSTDGSNWTDEFHETAGSGATHTIEIDSVTARYWRMYGISRNGGWGHSLWEFEIYEQTN